jgi:hypothetical protein
MLRLEAECSCSWQKARNPLEYKRVVLTVTTVRLFVSSLDASVVVVGLPTVIEELSASLFLGIWTITGYRLMLTVLLVSIG